jgi:putative toxin-antitoxin system antitoxin component (TIGR02293 family)
MPAPATRKSDRADRKPRIAANSGESLGLRFEHSIDVVRQLEGGLPYSALRNFRNYSRLTLDRIGQLVRITSRTLARRRTQGRLTHNESERLWRMAMIFEQAVRLFEGDVAAAGRWLESPSKALGGATPFAASGTEVGAREVESLIGRLEFGIFA